ncbi:putative ubiquitin carboxyl-terminal hydrolase MINDY-4 [Discoglossus pictus]
MENTFVEDISSSLVREFLSRKGLRKTSLILEEELPRNPQSICNRTELKSILHLDSLYKENKLNEKPLKTLLEIITKYFLEHSGKAKKMKVTESGNQETAPMKMFIKGLPSKAPESSELNVCDVSDDESGGSTAVSDTSKTEIIRAENIPFSKKPLQLKSKQPESSTKSSRLSSEGDTKELLKLLEPSFEAKHLVSERPKSSRIIRGMSGPVASSQEDSLKKRAQRRSAGINIPNEIQGNDVNNTGGASNGSPANTALQLGKAFSAKVLSAESSENLKTKSPDALSTFLKQETYSAIQTAENKTKITENDKNFKLKLSSEFGKERRPRTSKHNGNFSSKSRNTLISISQEEPNQKGDLKLDDVEDDVVTGEIYKVPALPSRCKIQVEGKPIDLSQAVEIKKILFGSSLCCFSEEWKMQSFTFNNKNPLKYGFVQKKGGPCGVLAAVQGCMLKNLLFGKDVEVRALQPSDTHRTRCLCKAIADVLWRAGAQEEAAVALTSGRHQFSPAGRYKADGILETLIVYRFRKHEDLVSFLQQNINTFEYGPYGCILLTLSVVLSRSVEQVQKDFDVPTNCLIGAHSYCTQELVNLILCGRAVSNVFNDKVELDSGNGNITLLKGIDRRSDIGFLSLFEHYSVCQVGSYLKTPKYPIWVVCSESHFSVLFCLKKELMSDWKMERKFDLYYYDGLANQQEEICLTIDTAETYIEDKDDELVPPLEYCIRTKWKGAVVDWNGTEPIL